MFSLADSSQTVIGVWGTGRRAATVTAIGVYGDNASSGGTGWAGYFNGATHIAGALSKITGYLEDFSISIEKILQLPDDNKKISVPIIIFTHTIKKNKLLNAINLIEKQDFVLEKIPSAAIT